MIINFLEEFRNNALRFQFNHENKNSIKFDPETINFATQCLIDICSENKFIVHQKISNGENTGLKANENWIIYHLAQSGYSLGSILIILEIAYLIDYYSGSKHRTEILFKKFKKKNGDIHELGIRSGLFELYCAVILEKTGLNIEIDDLSDINKPLDISIITPEDKITVECKTICESNIENKLIDIVSYLTHSYHRIIETNKQNHNILRYLPVSLFLCVQDRSMLEKASMLFKNTVTKYQSDIKKVARGSMKIDIPYISSDNHICTFNIEPYKVGLYETYSGFRSENDIFLKFRLFPRESIRFTEYHQEMEFQFKPKLIADRIKDALEDKKRQHKDSSSNKIFFFEYENYTGFRVPFDEKSIPQDRIKGLLKENEVVCIIHKDSTQLGNIKRRLIVIAKHENKLTIKLRRLNLNPFIIIK